MMPTAQVNYIIAYSVLCIGYILCTLYMNEKGNPDRSLFIIEVAYWCVWPTHKHISTRLV